MRKELRLRFQKRFASCPRCGIRAYEHLRTYSHCVSCFFIEDRIDDVLTNFEKEY